MLLACCPPTTDLAVLDRFAGLDPARIQGNGPKVFNRYILPGTRYSLIQQYTCISVGHGKHDLCLHLQSSAPDSPSHGSLRSSRRSRGGESARRPILGQLQALTEKFKELSCINHFKFSLRDDAFKGCLLYTSPSPRDLSTSRMPSSA